jgi:hypothetical protein
MSDNPFWFTVKVVHEPDEDDRYWVEVWRHGGSRSIMFDETDFDDLAEANEHAELIRQAMREVS